MTKSQHFWQLARFGFVGLSATLVNNGLYFIFYHYAHIEPVLANFLGFIFAVFVSYFGHDLFTFKTKHLSHKAFVKFAITALLGLAVNTLIVFLIAHAFKLAPWVAIPIMIVVTPLITFGISKYWVFKA